MGNRLRAAAALAAACAVALVAVLVNAAGAATKGKQDSGTSYAGVVYQKGKTLYAAGYSFDKLFGQIAVTYVTTVAAGTTGTIKVNASPVTQYTANGTLVGTASAVQNLATGAVSDGKLNLTRGTGGQKGHSFTGTFSGAYDSSTHVYTFHYQGTYK